MDSILPPDKSSQRSIHPHPSPFTPPPISTILAGMTDKKPKLKLLVLSQPQRATLEGISNRRPQLPSDPLRDELAALGLVAQQGAKWTLTPTGKKVLAAGSNRRNSGGFSV